MKHHGLKSLLPYLIISILLIILLLIIKVTGALQLIIAETSYCRPAIRQGTIVAISSWKKPERNHFVCFYEPPAGLIDHKTKGVLRLTGLPGDTIEIRNGEVFVNNLPADRHLDIVKEYAIPDTLASQALKLLRYDTSSRRFHDRAGSIFLQLVRKDLLKLEKEKIPFSQSTLDKDFSSPMMHERFHQNWNPDHFGPYIVPAGHFFLLGDNRNQCRDSRDFGPLPAERLAGTVLNH